MKTRTTAMLLTLLLVASLLGLIANSKTASSTPSTIQVPSSNYPTIQAAINNATSGDTILVAPGTYKENLVINQTVTLKGSGQDVSVIEAKDNTKPVVDMKINNANLTGFTITGGTVGVNIYTYNASTITNNTINSNSNWGIQLENSSYNLINNNLITRNTYAGIAMRYSDNNRINNNTISFHDNVTLHDQGIWMESSGNNTITDNIIANNAWNIDIFLSNNNTIVNNTVSGSPYRIALDESNDNAIFHNNFFYSISLVDIFGSSSTWDNGTAGNYWEDYNGTDENLDGIGDTYLPWHGVDYHPLMSPWYPPNDVTPPTTTDDYDGLWHNATFTIHLTAVDDISGVKATYYKVNGASKVSNLSIDGQPVISREAANNTLEYWSVDGFGKEEKPHHNLTGIKLDRTPPSGSIQIDNGSAYALSRSVTLSLSANDSLSGVAQMRFSDDGASWTPWEAYNTTKAWNLTSPDGLETVYVQYRDNASLVSQTYSATITLDTLGPTVLILSPHEGSQLRSSSVTIQWNATITYFGVDHYEVKLDDGLFRNIGGQKTYTYNGLSDGTHTVTIKVVDVLGRTSETSVSFVVNTSPIGGPGYIEEIVLIVLVAASIMMILIVLRVRKKGQLEPVTVPQTSAKT